MTERILISTGGSGGHVVPATIIYEHLKNEFQITMTSDNRGLKFLDKKKCLQFANKNKLFILVK